MSLRRAGTIALALLIDRLLGDPPNRFHPVAYMGQAIGTLARCSPGGRHLPSITSVGEFVPVTVEDRARFVYGAALVLTGALAAFLVGRAWDRLARSLPAPLSWLMEAFLFELLFSLRGLTRAAGEVRQALGAGHLDEARRLLSWHLVSRNTDRLSPAQVAGAAIESVAENASDGIVAPMFYYAVGGLPAALAYRFISTCDAMLGYRDPLHEWLGKASARLDDLANLAPARLTALLIILAAWLRGGDAGGAWHSWRRDARLTASPNAGHPMSAMAGALGVELEKVDHYRLGAGHRPPTSDDIGRAARLVSVSAVMAAMLLGLAAWLLGCRAPSGESAALDECHPADTRARVERMF
jgi:adenosylcobinamide-phosphate synthase